MIRRFVGVGTLALLALATGCGSTVTGTAELTGSVDQALRDQRATAIQLTDETGKVLEAGLSTDGTFQFAAVSGHQYTLAVKTADGTVPVLFPRSGGQLSSTFKVSGIGTKAALGALHLLHEVPAGGFPAAKATSLTCVDDGEHEDGEHEDGEHEDGEANDGEHEDGEYDDDGGQQGEFEGDHQDEGDSSDGSTPAAFVIADNPLPDQLGCGADDADEEDGDDEEDDDGDGDGEEAD